MSKDSSREVMTEVSPGKGLEITAPKFKLRKVSAIRDFPLGYRRGTASDFGLNRQITVNQSDEDKCSRSLGYWL
ncbi:hypothetical protein J1N35_000898 [Gossypium stocksii]|uniref:Uncharacterized protein n=1 Tax=Gossypium stocksii TaxID=47602 RepID=A0A9D3WI25_9ROSI|nr:hypothetical protein J1N35_000898 [Gossypium stocksii]